MITNTTSLPVNLAGEVLRNYYLNNSKRMVTAGALDSLPKWARNKVKSLLSDSVPHYGFIGNDMSVITQNTGDTLLVIFDLADGVLYWNDDAKKDYGWQREN